jgi:membrane protease YdiL (CAAX protease family)
MNDIASLKQSASKYPIGCFLTVLIIYSAIVGTAIATVFEASQPIFQVAVYAWGPMISAGIAIWLADESLRDWLAQLGTLRAGLRWYLIGVGMMLLGTEFETIVVLLVGGDVSAPAAPIRQYLLLFGVTLFLAGAIEELGWRGFLQPRLQRRFTAVGASVGIGLLWTAWHTPMIIAGLGNFAAFWEYALNLAAISIIFGWLYNSTNAALPVVMVTHASHNMPPIGVPVGTVPAVFDTLSGDTMVYLLCALLVILYGGAQKLTRAGTLPGVPGQLTGQSLRHDSHGE